MRLILAAMIVAAVALGPAPTLADQELRSTEEGQVQGFSPEDRAMNAAIAEARRTLPLFWGAMRAGEGERFTVKVEFPGRETTEHMWVRDVAREGDRFVGILDNEPYDIPTMHRGDQVTFDEAQITDWSYLKDGRMWGAFTTRVMVDHMSGEDAAEWRAILSPTPTEGRVI